MDPGNSAVHERVNEDYSCRICLEPAERSEVIAPCACKGTSKWVHRGCLNHWRSTREDIAFSKCTECLQSYELTSRADDTCRPRMMRRGKFFLLVLRDSCGAFLCTQLAIVSLSCLIYAFDRKTSRLLVYFHSGAHVRLFYYSCGLIIFLATIGMLYFCVGSANEFRTDCTSCCIDPTGSNMMCLECCGRGRVTGAPLFFDSSCCTCCSDSSCTCCGDAAGTSLSSECLPVVFVVLILFAFVGAIIVVLAGTVFIQKIARTHIHVLQKRGLADDFIVSDLDKEECDRNGIVRSFNQKGNGFYSFNESNNNSYDLVNSNHTNTDIGNLSNDYYMNSHNYIYNSNNGNYGGQHLSNEERNQNRDQIVSPLVSFPTTSDHTFPSSSTPSSNHRTSRMSNIYMDQISESNVRNSFNTSTLYDSEFTDIEEGKVIDADRENTENSLSSAPLLTPHQRRELISLGLL